jgi:predicted nuclease of predicted toxin-antitoxin system
VRILADENIPRLIVAWLRAEGHDVLYASESRARTLDADLLTEAEAQGYVVLTEDKDFGELVFRDRRNSHGVVLLRLDTLPASRRLTRLQTIWALLEANLPGKFLVITETKVRMRCLTLP